MENEEDEAPAASNALPNSSPVPSPPQLEDDSAPATAATASPDRDVGEVEIGVSESAQPRVGDGEDEGCVGAVRESEAEAARTADGEGVADVISGEEGRTAEEVEVREDMEWAEIAREERDATGEEEEEAVEENREVEGIEKDAATEVEDFVGDAEATPNAGGDAEVIEAEEDAEVDGVSLHIADDVVVDDAVEDTEAGVYAGEDTVVVADAGEDIEVEDTEVVDAEEDTEVVDAEEDTEVAELGADTEVVDAEEDTEVADAGQDAEGDTEVADAEEDTEVADAYEDAEVGDDNAGDTEVVDAADYTGLAEVGDTADEMAEEADEAEEETEVADGADEAEEETEVADGADEADEETEVADAAEEADAAVETEVEEATKSGGKRKRGRITKAAAKSPSKKKGEEDVCFICFDGGELVLCDRRGCPKAYHPACVNRDEAFFRTKGRWNCGWHLCSNCEKNANYMCYTCTFSLCKGCIKDAVILCVRGSKGFCEACMKTVMMIEQKEQENPAQVNFDDKSSWEYLFKDYWTDLKERLGLTSDEIAMAKNPWKGSHVHAGKQESPDELYDANDDGGSGSDFGTAEASLPKKRKPKKRLRSRAKAVDSPSKATAVSTGRVKDDGLEWASNALLEFVMHMRDGDKSKLSPFEVQDLLLVYIKRNKLRDPRKKSQTICDQRLLNLFGKKVVGHFEMLKLLESHFYVKEDFQGDDVQGSVVDTKAQLEADGSADAIVKAGKDRKRRRKNERVPQSNLDDYAAIDIHNISLIYLKRNLLEDLIEDTDNFHDKVVGTFVRVRISGSVKNQDMYRLVQVVGTSEAAEPYKVGKRMTHTLLEILNLDKTEVVSIDTISNHEFSEDECKRLRQSIKCGLINRLTVGDIQEKAMALQEVRVKDWLEAEVLRLSHLRDRASDLGKRKQLRECVEKLQLLKSPEERQRRLEEIPEIHVDPNMDPNYESEEAEIEEDEKKQESYLTPRGSAFVKRGREPISPRMGGSASSDSWSGTRNYSSTNREFSRSMSNKGYFNKGDDAGSRGEIVNENAWNQGRHMETPPNSHEKPKTASMGEAASRNIQSVAMPDSFSGSVPDISPASLSASVTQSTDQVSETEKMWHYRDPSGKVQGPFSMVQLRKWNKSGYFPTELKIWRASGNQDDSILLTDALAGKIQKEQPIPDNSYQKIQTVQSPHISSYSGKPYGNEGQGGERSHLDQSRASWKPHGSLASSGQSAGESWRPEPETTSLKVITAPSVEVPKYSTGAWGSDYNRSDLPNLPSPTPTQSAPGGTKSQAYESKWSPTSFPAQSAGSALVANQLPGGNGLRESAPAASVKMPVVDGSNVFHGAFSQHTSVPGNKVQNVMEYLGGVSTNFGGQSMRSSENDMNSRQMHPQPVVPSESHRLQVNTNLHQAPNSSDASISSGAHGWVSGLAAKPEAIPSGPVPGSERQAWGSAPSQKLEPNNTIPNSAQAPSYGHYGDAPSTIHASASSFNTGNQTGGFSAGGFSGLPQSSDPWRPPVSGHQPNNQPSVPAPQLNNQPTGPWVGPMPGNPNMGWMGQAPGNLNWGVSGQAPTFANPNPGRAAPSQVPAPGNTNPGWAAPGQGPPPPVNPNPGWVAPPAQGALPGNPNPGWAPPTGNPGMWGGEQSQNGDRFSGQRSSHGGDSGYGGNNNKPWNRQSSFGGGGGGGSSRPRVCKFHENGHCKKGSSCNYLHT